MFIRHSSLPPQPAAGLPVNLLENRPDIQAARLSLESADWTVGAARAARLPTLSLSGSIYTSEEKIENLFDDWISNLAASLVAPLLDGGARKAEVDRTLAVSRERIAAYRLSVLEAVQETEDALSSEQHQADYVEAIAKQYEAAKNSEAESIRRYQRGILPFLDTLTAIVARESLEITHVQAKADLLGDRIQLYRALGGNWTFMLEEDK
jgi:outer membrane protein TolC